MDVILLTALIKPDNSVLPKRGLMFATRKTV